MRTTNNYVFNILIISLSTLKYFLNETYCCVTALSGYLVNISIKMDFPFINVPFQTRVTVLIRHPS